MNRMEKDVRRVLMKLLRASMFWKIFWHVHRYLGVINGNLLAIGEIR